MVRSAHSGILGHVSVPSLMNLYFTSAQQSGQPSGPNQGTFSSHQASNTKSVSGPGTSISYTGGLGVGFIHHRRTEDWEGYGRTPATAGYEMSSMTAARNQQYSGAAGFGRSRSTASRDLDVNTASEDQIRYRELSGLDFAVFQGDFSSQTPYTPQMSLPSENGRINNGYQPTVAFFQAVDDLNYTEHRNSQSYIDRPGPYISDNDASSFNNVQLPVRKGTQLQYPSNPRSSPQVSRSYVSPYSKIQQPSPQSQVVTQSSNMSSYSAGNDLDTFGAVSIMRYEITQQPSQFPHLSDIPSQNTYHQQSSDGPTGLVSSDNSIYNGFDGLPSPQTSTSIHHTVRPSFIYSSRASPRTDYRRAKSSRTRCIHRER